MSEKRKEYMNYEAIKKQILPFGSRQFGAVAVNCYDRGLWKVCPNPLDLKRCMTLEQQYDMGQYISKETITISKDVFENSNNWN